jgi:hypothetical protein
VATIDRCLPCHPEARRIGTDIGDSDHAVGSWASPSSVSPSWRSFVPQDDKETSPR